LCALEQQSFTVDARRKRRKNAQRSGSAAIFHALRGFVANGLILLHAGLIE
jgi:hypothetical protein